MTAVWPLQVALDATIQGDATLSAKLRGEKVYSLTVPATDDVLPYILLGQSSEAALRMFGGRGTDGIETITIWSADTSKAECAGIVADLERLFDGTVLALTGGVHFCAGIFSLVALTLDPSGKYSMATCHYEVTTFA